MRLLGNLVTVRHEPGGVDVAHVFRRVGERGKVLSIDDNMRDGGIAVVGGRAGARHSRGERQVVEPTLLDPLVVRHPAGADDCGLRFALLFLWHGAWSLYQTTWELCYNFRTGKQGNR